MTTNDMVVDVSLEWVLAAMSRSVLERPSSTDVAACSTTLRGCAGT